MTVLASQIVQNRFRQREQERQTAEQERMDREYALGHRYATKHTNHLELSRENLNELVEQEIKARGKAQVNLESVCI